MKRTGPSVNSHAEDQGTSNTPIDLLIDDVFVHIANYLPVSSLMGRHPIHAVRKDWNRWLSATAFLQDRNPDTLVSSCKDEADALFILNNEIIMENLEFIPMLKIACKIPKACNAIIEQLEDAELEALGRFDITLARQIASKPALRAKMYDRYYKMLGTHSELAHALLANPDEVAGLTSSGWIDLCEQPDVALYVIKNLERFNIDDQAHFFEIVARRRHSKNRLIAMEAFKFFRDNAHYSKLIALGFNHLPIAEWIFNNLELTQSSVSDLVSLAKVHLTIAQSIIKKYRDQLSDEQFGDLCFSNILLFKQNTEAFLKILDPSNVQHRDFISFYNSHRAMVEQAASIKDLENSLSSYQLNNSGNMLKLNGEVKLYLHDKRCQRKIWMPKYIETLKTPGLKTLFDEHCLKTLCLESFEAATTIFSDHDLCSKLDGGNLKVIAAHSHEYANWIIKNPILLKKLEKALVSSCVTIHPNGTLEPVSTDPKALKLLSKRYVTQAKRIVTHNELESQLPEVDRNEAIRRINIFDQIIQIRDQINAENRIEASTKKQKAKKRRYR